MREEIYYMLNKEYYIISVNILSLNVRERNILLSAESLVRHKEIWEKIYVHFYYHVINEIINIYNF